MTHDHCLLWAYIRFQSLVFLCGLFAVGIFPALIFFSDDVPTAFVADRFLRFRFLACCVSVFACTCVFGCPVPVGTGYVCAFASVGV